MKVELSKDEIEAIFTRIDEVLEIDDMDEDLSNDERVILTSIYKKLKQLVKVSKSQESRQYELKPNFLQTMWKITGI
jgi:hypothetical protein